MSTTNHTPEPWVHEENSIVRDNDYIANFDGSFTACLEDEANARRAVQCVNACVNLKDPAKALEAAREALKYLVNEDNYLDPDFDPCECARIALQLLTPKS